MKKLFLLVALHLVLSPASKAQTPSATQAQQVQQAVVLLFEGFSAMDAKQIIRHCTPDVTILENGVIWNADTLRVRMEQLKGRDIKRVNKLDFTQTEVRGNTAWTTYHNQAIFTVNGQEVIRQWLESAVLVKEGNDWKVKMLHSTVVGAPRKP